MNPRECKTHGWLDSVYLPLQRRWIALHRSRWCGLCGVFKMELV